MSSPPFPSAPARPWLRDLLLLVLVFGVIYGFRLGSYPLGNPDEGRYSEIPREMLATGDWVTPRLNGVNYFEKPPLVYWLVAISQRAFGPGELAQRAVPALFALAGILLTYAAGRRLYGRDAGLAAAAVLGSCVLFFVLGHILILDMAVSVLMSATLFCFILGIREPAGTSRRWFFYGLYASAALATLTKGLMGFLVTGAVMFLWLLVCNEWRRLRPLYLPSGIALFLAIAAPWHLLAAQRNETWVHRYLVYEHFERFLTPAASRPGKWHYFIWVIIGGLVPWTGLLWPALRDALRGGWAKRREQAEGWFLVVWSVFIFLFFTKSKSKLAPYILPIFPALAVLVGAWLARTAAAADVRARLRPWFRGAGATCWLLAAALGVILLRPEIVRMDAPQALALRTPMLLMAAVLAAGGLALPWLLRTRGVPAALLGGVATMAVFFGGVVSVAPDIQKPGTKSLAAFVTAHAAPGDRVMHYHEFFHDFTFYAARTVDIVGFKGELELEEDATARASGRFPDDAEFHRLWTGPTRLWVVARKTDVKELFADPAFRYHLLGQTEDHILFSNKP
jgi:4-amino-4-deoxy-L-arabinose transferase-like glycosyltransferase